MYRLIVEGESILGKSNNLAFSSDGDFIGVQITFDSLCDIPEGAVINLIIGTRKIVGIIVSKSLGNISISYTAIDFGMYLKNEVTKQFNNVSTDVAIVSLLNEYGIKCKCVSIPTIVNDFFIDKSLKDIIDELLEKAENEQGIKYSRRMQETTVVISKIADEIIKPSFKIKKDFSISKDISEMKNKIIAISGSGENASIVATTENNKYISKYGLLQEIITVDDKDLPQAKQIAENLLLEKCKVKYSTSLSLLVLSGGEDILANKLIYIDAGELKGYYKIKSASHTLSNNKHLVTVELEW
ncbi:MAG: hypothetical protein RSF40_11020 [Oscillospiraceae bacterium]